MKKRTLITKLTLLCVGLLFFASCSNLLGFWEGTSSARNGGNGKVIFNGSICVTGALPAALSHAELDSAPLNSPARSAIPSFTIGTEYYYYVTATQTDGSGLFSINSIVNSELFNTTSGVTFALELTEGNWKIEAGIKNDDASVMSETYPATVSTANPVVSHTFYPMPTKNGKGNVALQMTFTGVSKITTACSDEKWASDTISPEENEATLGKTGLDSGTYEVTINFYDPNGNLLYYTVQSINVFDNMTTNSWVSDESGVIEDGKFELSQDLITQFTRTTFYVGQTKAATSLNINASDKNGTGSVYSPLESVTKVASIIAAAGDRSKEYRIYVCGTVKGAQEISSAVNGKANSITIQGYNGLDENLEPKDVLDGNKKGTTLTINSSVSVKIKNLKITGGTGTSVNGTLGGGGIYTGDTASLYLESGALVTGNTAEDGGGIYSKGKLYLSAAVISKNTAEEYGGGVYSTGSVFMYGSAVIGDKSKTSAATESDYSNKAGSKGAGIYSTGNLYLGYSSWTNNSDNKTEPLTGGVFYNFAKDTGGIHQLADEGTSRLFKVN